MQFFSFTLFCFSLFVSAEAKGGPSKRAGCSAQFDALDLQQELSRLSDYFTSTVEEIETKISSDVNSYDYANADDAEVRIFQRLLGNMFSGLRDASDKIQTCQSSLAEDFAVVADEAEFTEDFDPASDFNYAKLAVGFLDTTMGNTSSMLSQLCSTFPNFLGFDDSSACSDSINPIRLGLMMAGQACDSTTFGLSLALQGL